MKKTINSLIIISALITSTFFLLEYFFRSYQSLQIDKSEYPEEHQLMPDWEIDFKENILYSPIPHLNDIFEQTNKSIYAIDQNSGRIKYQIQIEGSKVNSPPAVSGNYILAANNLNEVELFNNLSGEKIWTSNMNNKEWHISYPEVLSMVISEKYAVVARYGDFIYFLDIIDGKIIRKDIFEEGRSFIFLFTFENRLLIYSSTTIKMIDINTFSEIWSYSDVGLQKNPIVYSKYLYFYTNSKNTPRIDQLDINKGVVIQSYNTQINPIICMAITDNYIMLSGFGVHKISKNEIQKSWDQTEIEFVTCPAIYDDIVFVRKLKGDLYKISNNNGNIESYFPIAGGNAWNQYTTYSPLIIGENIILPKSDTSIQSLHISNSN